MQTENLNEMIQQDSKQPFNMNDPDYTYTLSREKLTYDDVKKEISAKANPEAQIVTQATVKEATTSDFEPESEEALIAYTADIHNRVQTVSIGGYWEIGRTINSFYKGKYGTNELERIAQATGIGRDTLAKTCRFAKKYSREELEVLLKGSFTISWGQIAQNLTVSPQKVIEVYQTATDKGQFYNGIIKLKDPSESRGKSRSESARPADVIIETTPVSDTTSKADASIPSPAKYYINGNEIELKNNYAEENIQLPGSYEMEGGVDREEIYEEFIQTISSLTKENERLKQEISEKVQQISSLNSMIEEDSRDIQERDRVISAYKERFQQLRYQIEDGNNISEIMDLLAELR